ncbi:AraC family ligand binding domain-containing protein, partial [Paenibacillus sepulcri]|nr:AraC family ligand binding domain-containing protein [Paenibacillus sepulcri]
MQDILSRNNYMKDEFPFWITRTVQGSISEHGHEFVELVYVVRGKGMHIFQGSPYEVHAGDVFIINPGETHAYYVESSEQIDIINCLFMPSFISDALLSELEITGSMDYFYVHPFLKHDVRFNHRLNLHGQDADSVQQLLDSMIRELDSRVPGYKTLIRLQMIELLVLLSRYYAMMQ